MKSFLRLLIGTSLLLPVQSDAQSVLQGIAGKIGGTGADAGYSIAADAAGNTYVVGSFNGASVSFSPIGASSISTTLTSQGIDAFVVKLNSSGSAVWAMKIGGTGADIARAVDVDNAGNVYVAGTFTGSATVGSTTLNAAGGSGVDIFICKINSSGSLVWAKSAGGGGAEALWDMVVNRTSGSVYLTGSITAHATTPTFGSIQLTSNGGIDAFVCKLNSAGDFVWAQNYGGSLTDAGYGIALQPGSNALVTTGHFMGTATFPNSNQLTAAGGSDIFVYKSDTNGNFVWVKKMGGSSNDQARDVAVDQSGNIYSTGYFSNSANFDPNGTHTVNGQVGYNDVYVSKLNSSGNFVYAYVPSATMLPSGSEEMTQFAGEAIAVDASGNAFVTGRIDYAVVDFAPGAPVYALKSKGSTDIFVMGIGPSGDLSWVRTFGAGSADAGYGIALDNSGAVYTTGSFGGTVVFNADPKATTPSLTAGATDIFIHKMTLKNCTSTIAPVTSQSACDTFHYDGKDYTTSQQISALWVNAAGCDSMITIDLTVSKRSTPSLYTPPAQCDSFTFFGTVYTQTGQYDHMLTNVAGCDSLVTLDVTIIHSSWDTLFRVANCEGYTFEGNTYTESGYYVHTFPHSNGCDSNVVLSLTIDTVNVGVTVNENTITADESNAIWQWLDCDNQYAPIANADQQSFTPEKSGRYAVAVTFDGCTDTSECVTISIPDQEFIFNVANANTWKLYPNPVDQLLFVDVAKSGYAGIFGIDGRMLMEVKLVAGINKLDVGQLQSGVYIMRIFNDAGDQIGRQKMVKSPQ